MTSKSELSRRAKQAWATRKGRVYEKKSIVTVAGYHSHKLGNYVKFILSINCKCKKHVDLWSMKYSHISDRQTFFGYVEGISKIPDKV